MVLPNKEMQSERRNNIFSIIHPHVCVFNYSLFCINQLRIPYYLRKIYKKKFPQNNNNIKTNLTKMPGGNKVTFKVILTSEIDQPFKVLTVPEEAPFSAVIRYVCDEVLFLTK